MKKVLLLIIGGFLIVGGIAAATDHPSTAATPAALKAAQPSPTEATSDLQVTPEMVADAMGPAAANKFCTQYNLIGDYNAGLVAFKHGYGEHQTPSAEAVFDEFLSRC